MKVEIYVFSGTNNSGEKLSGSGSVSAAEYGSFL